MHVPGGSWGGWGWAAAACKAELTEAHVPGAQFNSASLNRHLSQAYNANVGGYSSRGFVEVGRAWKA